MHFVIGFFVTVASIIIAAWLGNRAIQRSSALNDLCSNITFKKTEAVRAMLMTYRNRLPKDVARDAEFWLAQKDQEKELEDAEFKAKLKRLEEMRKS
jgi:hypothetical protein